MTHLSRNSMKRPGMKWLGVLLVLIVTGVQTASADLRIPDGQERPVVFSGRDTAIEIRVTNDAAEAVALPLEYRIFQVAGGVLAPIGERKAWRNVSLLEEQTSIERLELSVPELRATSLFRVAFYSGEKDLGRTLFLAVPPRLLAEFGSPVAVSGNDELAAALKELGMNLRSVEQVDPATIVLLQSAGDQPAGEIRQRAKDLAAKAAATILLTPAREFARAEGRALQSLTGMMAIGRGRLLIAKQLDFSKLATSADAQLGLYQLLALARDPEVFPWLD